MGVFENVEKAGTATAKSSSGLSLPGQKGQRISKDVLWIGMTVLAMSLVAVVSTSVTLYHAEEEVREQAVHSLETLLESSVSSLSDTWAAQHISGTKHWAEDSLVAHLTINLLQSSTDPQELTTHPTQRILRDHFSNLLDLQKSLGMFIINRDNISIASMRNQNLGSKNVISYRRPLVLQQVFQGGSRITPPFESDVPLPNENGELIAGYPTMFVMSPIRDGNDSVIAVLAIRLNPFDDFTRILQAARVGESGELYAVDRAGRLASHSRFADALLESGLVQPHPSSIYGFEVRENEITDLSNKSSDNLQMKKPRFTRPVLDLLTGKAGHSATAYPDYRGQPVVGAWVWDDKLQLGFIAEIDEEEAIRSYVGIRTTTYLGLVIAILVALVFTLILHQSYRAMTLSVETDRKYLKALVENVIDGIVVINENYVIQSFNSAAEEMFGYSCSEVIGVNVNVLLPSLAVKDSSGEIFSSLEAQDISSVGRIQQLLGRCKDGSEFPVKLGLNEVLVGQKRVLVGTIHDLSETEKAKESLAQSERRFSQTFNHAPLGFVTASLSCELIQVNDQFCAMLGRTESELVGCGIDELLIPVDSEEFGVALTGLHSGINERITTELQFQKSDGSIFWGRLTATLETDYTDDSQYMMAVLEDISARVKADAEVRKLSRAVESSPAAVMITDVEGVAQYVNSRFVETLGVEVEEIVGARVSFMNPFTASATLFDEMWKTLLSGRQWRGEYEGDRIGGETYWERVLVSPIRDDRGEISHFVSVSEDITDAKRSAEELERAKIEAEDANMRKGKFLSAMSHELRTPLNGIIGSADLMLLGAHSKLDAQQHVYTRNIDTSAQHLLTLINDLLDISKIDAGRMELVPERMNVREATDEVREIIAASLLTKVINLEFSCDDAIPETFTDPRKYKQILLNLLSNAMKYTPTDGEIRLSVRRIPENMMVVEVSDTGVGIGSDQLERIFDEFHQVNSARDEQLGGTGIGLALTRRMLKLMGGEISVSSVLGEGSVFSFTLPITPIPESEREALVSKHTAPLRVGRGEKYRILVVEDTEINLMLIRDMLAQRDYEITVARNGREAIDVALEFGPDLILMDMRMPIMGGLEAVRKLRELSQFSQTIIISLTGCAGKEEQEEQIEAGCDSHLAKPMRSKDLFSMLDSFLGTAHPEVEQLSQ